MRPIRPPRPFPRVLLCLLSAPLLSGCVLGVGTALGQGPLAVEDTVVLGPRPSRQKRDFKADLAAVWDAAFEALSHLSYPPAQIRRVDGVTGTIAGPEYQVRIKRRGEGLTRVSVSISRVTVETLGQRAEALLDEIGRILDPDVQIQEWTRQVRELSESGGDQ